MNQPTNEQQNSYVERISRMQTVIREAEEAFRASPLPEPNSPPENMKSSFEVVLPCGVKFSRGYRCAITRDEILDSPVDFVCLKDGRFQLRVDVHHFFSTEDAPRELQPILQALPGDIAEFDLLTEDDDGKSTMLDAKAFQSWSIHLLNGERPWNAFTADSRNDIQHIRDVWPKKRSVFYDLYFKLIEKGYSEEEAIKKLWIFRGDIGKDFPFLNYYYPRASSKYHWPNRIISVFSRNQFQEP